MKTAISNVYNGMGALQELAGMELPFKLSYRISRLITICESVVKTIEETRKKIIEKYGEKDEQGQLVQKDGQIKIADANGFQTDMRSFLEDETEIACEKIPLALLEESGAKLKPAVLMALNWLIE